MGLSIAGKEELHQHVTDARCLSTYRDCPVQTRHNYFKVRAGQNLGGFILVSGSEAICFHVCPTLQTCAHYPTAQMKKIAEVLRLERYRYSGVFRFRRAWVPEAWRIWPVSLS